MAPERAAPLIFYAWVRQLTLAVFGDDVGAALLDRQLGSRSFREALQQEEKHLRVIREWHTTLIMGESGHPKSGTRGTIEE